MKLKFFQKSIDILRGKKKSRLFFGFYMLLNRCKIFIFHYLLSDNAPQGKPCLLQPTLFLGAGKIKLGKKTTFGYFPSPMFFSTYAHIEARTKDSSVKIGTGTNFNNNAKIIARWGNIEIGSSCLIGTDFFCTNADFHSIDPTRRGDFDAIAKADVKIGDNVFIGSNVTILKGVTIGSSSTVGAGSVVTGSFPENSVIGGNPAKLIKTFKAEKHATN